MYWRNGELSDQVALNDRSFQYGDGCFTTIRTQGGKLCDWPLHIMRMESCLKALRISLPNWALVHRWLEQAALPIGDGGVKLHLSRGSGGRGYSSMGLTEPDITISQFTYPSHYYQWQRNGVELGCCAVRLGINPLLAGHKHNNRLEQIIAKSELDEQGFVDGLVCDINGNLIETTMANVFWRIGDKIFSPDLSCSGVSGIMRHKVIHALLKMGKDVKIGHFSLDLDSFCSIFTADEVWICNALLGVAPVTKITHQQQGFRFPIGKMTLQLQEV